MMSLRSAVFDLLASDATLAALGINAESLYVFGAVDTPPQRRFVVLRWGDRNPSPVPVAIQTLAVWAYDRERDFSPILDVLARVRKLLEGREPWNVGGGWVCGLTWTGQSPDLMDDVYGAITKNDTYDIAASGV
jgi:hypothetical protein